MRNEECVEGRAIRIIQVEAAPYVMHPLVLLRSHGGVPLGEVGDGTGLEAQEVFHLEVGVEVTHNQDFPKPRWEDRIAPAVAVVILHSGKFVDDSSTGPIIRRRNDSVDGIHERNSACSSW